VTARLLIATTNRGKQDEFRRLLAGLPGTVVTPDEIGVALEVDEPYDT
jgi:inosine/xanthosine triphosphate pyrophosphatase family protein